ncbi:HlyD family secretion protein [Chroococcidiopsis sp. TS-821]|uniref:HlyD family secretion protein n=1 Tax=Chroococcidiopsis sp. TS-821 TaxID=1378066 RepID=UPI000CEEA88F|nr:HlyD family secretion protein [Chroococcidiopsis sp. TS-821]PPS39853.1 secretion protein HlyD [Chroococcidiopsis sp. TS-821]
MDTSSDQSLNGKTTFLDNETKLQATPLVESDTEQSSTPPQQPQKEVKRNRKLGFALAGLGIGAIAAGVFGYHWWQYASTHESTDNATVAGHIHQISSRISGTVIDVPVNDNQLVQPRQLLVKLDPQDYINKVQQAQAALLAAQKQANAAQATINLASQNTNASTAQAQGNVQSAIAAIATAKAAVTEAQAGIPTAQASVAQAEANLHKAQVDYNRYNTLYQQGAIPRQQLDDAQAAYQVALAQRNSAQQQVAQAQAKLAQAQEGVVQAQAQLAASQGGLQQAQAGGQQTNVNRSQYAAAQAAIAQAQASLKDAQLQLSYTNITAPTGGRVGSKSVEVGQRVQPGQPLMAIVNNDYWVIANFKETQLEAMQPGQPVEIKLDAFAHHPFTGHIDSISPASGATFALLPPDNATGNFTKIVQRIPVKVTFDPQSIQGYESRIAPGMSAEVTVTVQ